MGQRHAGGQQREAEQNQRLDNVEYQQQAPAPAATASAGISSESVQKLQELGKLREQGVLTDDEFNTQKQRLLAV